MRTTWKRALARMGRAVRGTRPGWWRPVAVVAWLATMGAATPAAAQLRVGGQLGLETRGFLQGPLQEVQARHSGSALLKPRIDYTWDRRRQAVTFEPFLRFDAVDPERTHFDVRAFAWERAWRSWELRVGIRTVFWGVTESSHLVDIVNQTDLVENPDGEDKLGQPMVNLASVRSWGTIDIFVLPGFRERTYPGVEGRLRSPLPVSDEAVYAADAGSGHVDWALRWSDAIGPFDLGVSYFRGTSRDPWFEVAGEGPTRELRPHYDLVSQVGVDAQMTTGPLLLKLEGITRAGRDQGRYWAMTAGFEQTLYQIIGTNADVGLIAEYLFDDRGSEALTPFQDDVFVGARLALNDAESTELLGGVITDRQTLSTMVRLEGSRRVNARWTVDVEAVGLFETEPEELLHGLRRDDYVSIAVTRWF